MKKLKSVLALLIALVVATFFCACSMGGGLAAPDSKSFDIDENNLLTWISVRGAHGYQIEITNIESGEILEDSRRVTNYSLDTLQEGDYEIRLRAVGGNQNETVSRWSAKINFHKDYASGLIYTLINNNTEYMISKVGTAMGDVTIEDYYRGKPVTEIASSAFRQSNSLTGVVIGSNVTTIGSNAFYQCTLLVSVQIPKSVTSIGSGAFQGCTLLPEIELPDNLTAIEDNTFAYCRALEHINLGENLESIGATAFYQCSALKEVVIPDNVKTIGKYAFSASSDNALASVTLGKGLESIGDYAFSSCNMLSEINFSEVENLTLSEGVFADCDALTEIELPKGLVSIGDRAFYGSDALATVSIPDTVTSVGEYAFNGTALYAEQEEKDTYGGFIYADNWLVATTQVARGRIVDLTETSMEFKEGVVGFASRALTSSSTLRSITIPSTVKYLNEYSLYNNSQLFSLTTSNNSLEEIGYAAFAYCGLLNNIRFGSGLKSIGAYAFGNCKSVGNNTSNPYLLVPESVEEIGYNAFYGTDLATRPDSYGVIYAGKWVVGYTTLTTGEIELDSDVKGIADLAFYYCDVLRSVSGLRRVEHLGMGAFAMCSNLAYIDSLYQYLEIIKPQTFYGCSGLYNVNFPRYLEEIGTLAFTRSGLTKIDLSDTNVRTIGDGAFYECGNVQELQLSEDLERIGSYTFFGCTQIPELTVPDAVTEIGEWAFARCEAMESVTFGESVETIGDFAFRSCKSLTELTIPDSVKTIGEYAFENCTGVTSLKLGSGVEYIGKCAFYGLGAITTLELPASLTYLGDYAFVYCTMLRYILMQGEIGYVGAHAFYGSDFMTVYATFGSEVSEAWNGMWNSSYRPVVWDCTLGGAGYIYSAGEISNGHARYGVATPIREGYTFVGWSTEEWGEAELIDIRNAEPGTTLYAVWAEKE